MVSGQDDLDYDFDLSRIPTSIKIKKCCPIDQVRIILPYYKIKSFSWRLGFKPHVYCIPKKCVHCTEEFGKF